MPIPISMERYFLHTVGSPAVSTATSDEGGGQFKAAVEMPPSVVFTGDSNAVMNELSQLSNHFAAAREAILAYLTGGG